MSDSTYSHAVLELEALVPGVRPSDTAYVPLGLIEEVDEL
jgi:hypothetical protein